MRGPIKMRISLNDSSTDPTEVEKQFEDSLLKALQLRQKNIKSTIKRVDSKSKKEN
jgi:hypothetical protein